MRYNHFSMLPERAFQPRGRGMTLEGGAGDFLEDTWDFATGAVEDVVNFAGDVVGGAVEAISDAGSAIDDFVNEEIPGGWVTVAAVTAATMGVPLPPGSETAAAATTAEAAAAATAAEAAAAGTSAGLGAADAITAAEWFGGSGAAAAPGTIFGSAAAPTAFVPSAFETAIGTTTSAPPIGTAGFGTALAPASEVAAGLEAAGFAPGTSANLAGMTAAGTGATNLLGGATALAPLSIAPNLSLTDALRGARLINSLLTPEQQQMPQQQIGNVPQGGVDYSTLLGLLSRQAGATGLLGTRYQPQPINIASLLG